MDAARKHDDYNKWLELCTSRMESYDSGTENDTGSPQEAYRRCVPVSNAQEAYSLTQKGPLQSEHACRGLRCVVEKHSAGYKRGE